MKESKTRELRRLLQDLKQHTDAVWFIGAVNLSECPDYTRVIKRPMDLGMVETNLGEGRFSCAELFARDVRRTFVNAMVYNRERFPHVAAAAQKLLDSFEENYTKLMRNAFLKQNLSSGGYLKACQLVLSVVRRRKEKNYSLAEPFMHPLDTGTLQNYDVIVPEPMDLSTIESKLRNHNKANGYHFTLEFMQDMRRTFSNALRYNCGPEGLEVPYGFRVSAVRLLEIIEEMAGTHGIEVLPCETWRNCCSVMDRLIETCDKRNLLDDFVFFAFPIKYFYGGVEPENYRIAVPVPMDFGEALAKVLLGKTRIETDFLRDMFLIFTNCEDHWEAHRQTDPDEADKYINCARNVAEVYQEVASDIFGQEVVNVAKTEKVQRLLDRSVTTQKKRNPESGSAGSTKEIVVGAKDLDGAKVGNAAVKPTPGATSEVRSLEAKSATPKRKFSLKLKRKPKENSEGSVKKDPDEAKAHDTVDAPSDSPTPPEKEGNIEVTSEAPKKTVEAKTSESKPEPVIKDLKGTLKRMVEKLKARRATNPKTGAEFDVARPFLTAVDVSQYPSYAKVIKRPMDLGTVFRNISKGRYATLEDFTADIKLIKDNALEFNAVDEVMCTWANEFWKAYQDILDEILHSSSKATAKNKPLKRPRSNKVGASGPRPAKKPRVEPSVPAVDSPKQLVTKRPVPGKQPRASAPKLPSEDVLNALPEDSVEVANAIEPQSAAGSAGNAQSGETDLKKPRVVFKFKRKKKQDEANGDRTESPSSAVPLPVPKDSQPDDDVSEIFDDDDDDDEEFLPVPAAEENIFKLKAPVIKPKKKQRTTVRPSSAKPSGVSKPKPIVIPRRARVPAKRPAGKSPSSQGQAKFRDDQWEKGAQQMLRKLVKHPWVEATPQQIYLFMTPVIDAYPEIRSDYLKTVKEPMDIGTVQQLLNEGHYAAAEAFLEDLAKVFRNCVRYNGQKEDAFSRKYSTVAAHLLRYVYDLALEHLFNGGEWERYQPNVEEAQRQSGAAESEVAPSEAAKGYGVIVETIDRPTGWVTDLPVPNLDEGTRVQLRRVREAVVRDYEIPYRTRAKDCRETLKKLEAGKYKNAMKYFWDPVDLQRLPDYVSYIKKPISVTEMSANLDHVRYRTYGEFMEDLRLIFENGITYNSKKASYDRVNARALLDAKYMSKQIESLLGALTADLAERQARGKFTNRLAKDEIEEKNALVEKQREQNEKAMRKIREQKRLAQKKKEEDYELKAKLQFRAAFEDGEDDDGLDFEHREALEEKQRQEKVQQRKLILEKRASIESAFRQGIEELLRRVRNAKTPQYSRVVVFDSLASQKAPAPEPPKPRKGFTLKLKRMPSKLQDDETKNKTAGSESKTALEVGKSMELPESTDKQLEEEEEENEEDGIHDSLNMPIRSARAAPPVLTASERRRVKHVQRKRKRVRPSAASISAEPSTVSAFRRVVDPTEYSVTAASAEEISPVAPGSTSNPNAGLVGMQSSAEAGPATVVHGEVASRPSPFPSPSSKLKMRLMHRKKSPVQAGPALAIFGFGS